MALALVALVLAVPVPNPTQTGFLTPSGNIACNAGPYHGQPLVACTVFSEGNQKRGQKVWAVAATGRVSVGFVFGNAATDYPKLAYGRTWSWHGIRCSSQSRGLTCTNRSGHGYFLSRRSQRVF
jgi:hypothetical protein